MASRTSIGHRVAIFGGGIFGVSSALHLARLGADVTLITEGAIANGASGRSLSWLNSARRRSMEYHYLRMAGLDRYRTLATRFPDADWLRFDGALTWDADDATNEIAAIAQYEHEIGYDALLLDAADVAAVTPGVASAAITGQGAIFNPGEGWVDLPCLIDVLLADYRALGGQVVENAGHGTVDIAGGKAKGIVTANGRRFETDTVLVATGPWVPATLKEAGITMPDATPISLLLKTKPVATALRAVLNTPRVAVRPTPNGELVLNSAWSEAEVEHHEDGTYRVKEETVQGLLREASLVLDGNPKLVFNSYGVGPKPIPADGEPVFGPLETIENYFVAFSHSGATLGLIAGEMLAGEIATGRAHPMLAKFRPGRFAK